MKRFGKLVTGIVLSGTLAMSAACAQGGDNSAGGEEGVVNGFSQTLTYDEKVVISHDANHAYARIVEADDGTLIATGEDFSDSGIPIYISKDKGKTFVKNAENIHDPTYSDSAFDARWQPTLYVLPEDVGEMKKGDVLLVATSIDGNAETFYKTVLNLYISKDVGKTWEFLSEITRSKNAASSDGNENGCWEGNLFVNAEGQLACIFADETDHKNHAQRIAMKTTSDGENWSDLIEVVALDSPTQRPGMPSVTRIKNGEYFLAIEMVGEYKYTFHTNKGSCELIITVGGSEQTEGYKMQFAKPNQNTTADHFYSKASRDGDSITFDFLSYNDFNKEGTALEFINVLLDVAPFDTTGSNWRLDQEDMNIRVYSDGTVLYKTFTGTEEKNGISNGLDNIWWKINRTKPNYKQGNGLAETTEITRAGGVIAFSLDIPYTFLNTATTADVDMNAETGIRFALMEASDASSFDFNLYERGIVTLNGVDLANPERLANWPLLTADGEILRPEEIVETGVPAGYDLSFAKEKDNVYAKVSHAADGVKFDFWTKGEFDKDISQGAEFMNIYLDMPEFNTNGKNWCFEAEDINIRVYSNGDVYKKTNFDATADNVWYSRSDLTEDNKLTQRATITEKDGATTISVTIPYAELNTTKETFAGFRFWLAECSDKAVQFEYAGADFSYKGVRVGADARLGEWLLFDAAGNIIPAKDITDDGVPAGYDIRFGYEHGNGDRIHSKVSYEAQGGVTFDFWSKGNFGVDNDALEFVQIYLDMPAFNPYNGNWRLNSNEDAIVRIYSNGNVYLLNRFEDRADNIWIKLDHNTTTALKTIDINKTFGVTSFGVTLTLEQLGVAAGESIGSFRFYMAEAADNDGNFNYYGGGNDIWYQGKAFGDGFMCENYAEFELATGKITVASERNAQ